MTTVQQFIDNIGKIRVEDDEVIFWTDGKNQMGGSFKKKAK